MGGGGRGGGESAPLCILVAVVQPRFLLLSSARQRAGFGTANYNSRGAEQGACALTLDAESGPLSCWEFLRGRVSARVETHSASCNFIY